MAEKSSHDDDDLCIKKVNDALKSLEKGIFCNSFSERRKRQAEELEIFRKTVCASEWKESYRRFCCDLLRSVSEYISSPTSSSETRREKSYTLFYMKHQCDLSQIWNNFHTLLHLSKPDPVWTQTVNRLLFNDGAGCSLKTGTKEVTPPTTAAMAHLGADEDNFIRYMAGYVPFKLMKKYEKKDTEEAAAVVDCLSDSIRFQIILQFVHKLLGTTNI